MQKKLLVIFTAMMLAVTFMPALASAWTFSNIGPGWYDNYPDGSVLSGPINRIDAYITSGASDFASPGMTASPWDNTWVTGGWSAANMNSRYVQATTADTPAGVNWDYSFTGAGPVAFTLDWNAYNGLIFMGHEHVAYDGVTVSWKYDTTPYNAVPIPAAVWLLGSGLVGLVGLKRKFRP